MGEPVSSACIAVILSPSIISLEMCSSARIWKPSKKGANLLLLGELQVEICRDWATIMLCVVHWLGVWYQTRKMSGLCYQRPGKPVLKNGQVPLIKRGLFVCGAHRITLCLWLWKIFAWGESVILANLNPSKLGLPSGRSLDRILRWHLIFDWTWAWPCFCLINNPHTYQHGHLLTFIGPN